MGAVAQRDAQRRQVVMMGMQTRAVLGLMGMAGGLLWLGGCPDPEAANEEFNSSWCEVQANRYDNPPSNYCPCSSDTDCGSEDSGKVCNAKGLCQFGCRGVPDGAGGGGTGGSGGAPEPVFVPSPYGNTCALGIECTSSDDTIGKCGVSCDGAGVTSAELDGLYFFTFLPPIGKQPAPLAITITSTTEGGQLMMTMDIQPVSAADRLTPVGSSFQRGPYPVNADGSYEMDWGTVTFPGDTNPISGSDLVVDARLQGRFCSAESNCGVVSKGLVTSPITLTIDGSTFYFEKIDTIADHTEPPYVDCNQTQAPPLN